MLLDEKADEARSFLVSALKDSSQLLEVNSN